MQTAKFSASAYNWATTPRSPFICRLHRRQPPRIHSQLSIAVLAFILIFTCVITRAHAIPVTVSFAVSGFHSGGGEVPPTDPVVGSIVFDAASITSDIDSLTSIYLAIAGHTYTTGELGFQNSNPVSAFAAIGTPFDSNPCCFAVDGFNTFFIEWNQNTLMPAEFAYAAASAPGIWDSFNFTKFSVTAVPEPSSLLVLLMSAIILRIARRWKLLSFWLFSTKPVMVHTTLRARRGSSLSGNEAGNGFSGILDQPPGTGRKRQLENCHNRVVRSWSSPAERGDLAV